MVPGGLCHICECHFLEKQGTLDGNEQAETYMGEINGVHGVCLVYTKCSCFISQSKRTFWKAGWPEGLPEGSFTDKAMPFISMFHQKKALTKL